MRVNVKLNKQILQSWRERKHLSVYINSMAEKIKIYRNSNPRLGFLLNETTIANVYVDDAALRKLVSYINQQFLICSNTQSQCLIDGCIDMDNKFIIYFCIAIILPLAKSVLLNIYDYLFIQYLIIFAAVAFYLYGRFNKSQEMKQTYLQVQEELQERFSIIQEEFNKRFDYLQMEYVKTYDQHGQDYLQIKVVKIPSPMKALQERMKPKLKLTPLQE